MFDAVSFVKTNSYGIFKFVRLADESYRFFAVDTDHSSIVRPTETAVSAGFVVFDKYADNQSAFLVPENISSTLNLGPSADDKLAVPLELKRMIEDKEKSNDEENKHEEGQAI